MMDARTLNRLSVRQIALCCVCVFLFLSYVTAHTEVQDQESGPEQLYKKNERLCRNSGEGDSNEEESNSLDFMRLGFVLVISIGIITFLHQFHVTAIPESVIVMIIGMYF